jgi:hypothetical protein
MAAGVVEAVEAAAGPVVEAPVAVEQVVADPAAVLVGPAAAVVPAT